MGNRNKLRFRHWGEGELSGECWGILSTAGHEPHAIPALKRYHLRVGIEERHRHLECFWPS